MLSSAGVTGMGCSIYAQLGDGMDDQFKRVRIAARLAAAWVSNPRTVATAESITDILSSVHAGLLRIEEGARRERDAAAVPTHVPAVSVRQSLASPTRIISMIDGKPYATLRPHLAAHGLTAAAYRTRYNLKPDYPMVAPALSEQRRAVAARIGLGRSRGKAAIAEAPAEPVAAAPKRRKLTLALKG